LGPDSHGYFAYDNTDSAWPEAPTYTWFDLAGEAGAELTELVDDQLTRVALPFDFTFYGETFAAGDSITISSNGWLSFHEEDYDYANNFFRNWHIPSSMGPRGLVAGFWDDLKPTYPSTENMIELRTWYDADGGKYVVEWTNTVNRFAYDVPANYPAEFAVVLYDPAVHTTPTGDGVIEFHYLDVENVDERDNFATVGIERPDKTAGLEVTFALQYPDAAAVIEDGRAIRFTTTAPDNYAQGGEAAGPLPRELALHPATPNPFNSSVEVRFDLPREGRVRLEAFNVLGRRVATLLDEQMAAGRRTVRWNVPAGQVSSGMLLLRLQAADQVRWGKALYLK
jgi:hypothetical protein